MPRTCFWRINAFALIVSNIWGWMQLWKAAIHPLNPFTHAIDGRVWKGVEGCGWAQRSPDNAELLIHLQLMNVTSPDLLDPVICMSTKCAGHWLHKISNTKTPLPQSLWRRIHPRQYGGMEGGRYGDMEISALSSCSLNRKLYTCPSDWLLSSFPSCIWQPIPKKPTPSKASC